VRSQVFGTARAVVTPESAMPTNPAAVDFLKRIADDRRRRIEEAKQREPLFKLRERLGPARPAGRLERALRRGGPAGPLRLLCEIKRASPSRGVLKPDLDPVAFARVYQDGRAAAISLVTEPDHFQGDLAWVNAVRAAVTLPLLV
jgi:indole-3-glycerol phosphate synthase